MQILLPIHILAGTIALLCAALAVSSEKGKRLHVLAGRTYFWGMVTIFSTAIPMSIISSNIFLFLIAIFSFYLAFAGMRFARNRKGVATILDWIAICLMIFLTEMGSTSKGALSPKPVGIRYNFPVIFRRFVVCLLQEVTKNKVYNSRTLQYFRRF